MTFRTVVISSYEEYLAHDSLTPEIPNTEDAERNEWLKRFPHTVMLLCSTAEIDFANRWCWQEFGPPHQECLDRYSEYPVCKLEERHSHLGNWMWQFFEKTDYNYGYNEWYFASSSDYERFRAHIPMIQWGENFPKNPGWS